MTTTKTVVQQQFGGKQRNPTITVVFHNILVMSENVIYVSCPPTTVTATVLSSMALSHWNTTEATNVQRLSSLLL